MTSRLTDNTKTKLLGVLQNGFPLSREPYSDIGAELNIAGEEVVRLIAALKENGIVRQISPVLDARKIGYQSTLIAMQVPAKGLGMAEKILNRHKGISHAYEREHKYNIWFTLSLPNTLDMQSELEELSEKIGAESVFALPAVRVFKLRTNFGFDTDSHEYQGQLKTGNLSESIALSPKERDVINVLQEDLPLVPNPFQCFADKIDISVDRLLDICLALLQKGVIRRYGASVNHYKAGYKANAMTCWCVPHSKVEITASRIIRFNQVSHCYEREMNTAWPYNFYVMIHSGTRSACQDVVNKISSENSIDDFAVLFSIKEFKKIRIKYPV